MDRAAVIQLLKIMDEWTYNLDKGIQIDVIYTDFEKAFDSPTSRPSVNLRHII